MVYLYSRYVGLSFVGCSALFYSSTHFSPAASPVSSGRKRSKKSCSGIFMSIVCCFRLVRAVGGRTNVRIVCWRGSENQCLGTEMYSIFRVFFVGGRPFDAFLPAPFFLEDFFPLGRES